MTAAEWQASADPLTMIRWLEKQGYNEPLWAFAIACCRRVWDDIPGGAFHRVIEHAEQIGTHGIDDRLAEANQALSKLERRFHKADDAEQPQLSRQIGFGRMVFAFEHQAGAGAAEAVSRDLVDWADDADAEKQAQSDSLRQFVQDPTRRIAADEDEEA